MKLKTVKHEQVCPLCGCKHITKTIHYDGIVTGTNVVCANCGHTYELSKTYDADSSYGNLIDQVENLHDNADKETINKMMEAYIDFALEMNSKKDN